MKIKLQLIVLALAFYVNTVDGQKSLSIKGNVTDTELKKPLGNIAICILNAKDSTLIQFDYSKEDGSFNIKNLFAGDYILLLSHPRFADYVKKMSLESSSALVDLGQIIMKSKTAVLEEVVVNGKIRALQFKGDTVEFNARAYVIQPNDKVEDLLKQLPGIQVDQNGKITTQGQTVAKVLVDGEEFFGDDPTLVTRTIRSDMVDKIQLFDKKSDRAILTGIDEGSKFKTINIKLKEDKNRGVFGKLNGGIGTRQHYESQGIYNRFKKEKKFATFINFSNNGKMGLNNQDNNNIGFNSSLSLGSGLVNTGGGNAEFDFYNGKFNGKGEPAVKNGGLHYDGKWNLNKQAINGNYQIGSMNVTGTNKITSQQTLPSEIINTSTTEHFNNYFERQLIYGYFRDVIDSTSDIKVSFAGLAKHFNVINEYVDLGRRNDEKIINQQVRSNTNSGRQKLFDVAVVYKKKFKKFGRFISWEFEKSSDHMEMDGVLKSQLNLYNSLGIMDSSENVNQFKIRNVQNKSIRNETMFGEKLSNNVSIVFNCGLTFENSVDNLGSFNESFPGKYDVRDSLYSGDYVFNQISGMSGVNLSYKKGKTILNFGTSVAKSAFKQSNNYTAEVYARDFWTWEPHIYYRYGFSLQRSLSARYFGNSIQPRVWQMQPIKNNTDPLNIVEGNSTLKTGFVNGLEVTYHVNNPLNNRAMYVGANYSLIFNGIGSNIKTNPSSGRTSIQYINIIGNTPFTYSLFVDIIGRLGAGEISAGVTLNNRGEVAYNYINNLINRLSTHSWDFLITLAKNKKNKFDLSASFGPTYNTSKFSLQPGNDNNLFGIKAFGTTRIFLPVGFQVSSEIRYNYFGNSNTFKDQQQTLWNVSLTKAVLRNDNLKLSIIGNDLLDQDRLISRKATENVIMQSLTSTIGRYFMLSVLWDFTKFDKVANNE